MSKPDKLNNFSEDLFYSCSEPNECKIRRSQRLVEKNNLKTTTSCACAAPCTEDIFEDYSGYDLNESLLPHQSDLQTTTTTTANSQNVDVQLQQNTTKNEAEIKSENNNNNNNNNVDGYDTPDFTYMLNAEITLTAPQTQNIDLSHSAPSIVEHPLDLRSVPKKCNNFVEQQSQELIRVSKKRGRKRKVGNQDEKTTTKKVDENICIRKKGALKLGLDSCNVSVKRPIETQSTFSLREEVVHQQQKVAIQPCRTVEEKFTETVLMNKLFSNIKEEEDKHQMPTGNVLVSKIAKSKKNDADGSPKQNVSHMNSKNKARKPRMPKTPKKRNKRTQRTKFNTKPKSLSKNEKQKSMQPSADDKIMEKDYIAPKVVRYYNSYPTATTKTPIEKCYSSYGNDVPYNPNNSLLPAIYPPHFSQQITMASVANVPPLSSYLTPENSQLLPASTCLVTKCEVEEPLTPSTTANISPISLGSLQEFFEIDELCDIMNTDKVIYRLTEIHVRALAYTLNLNADDLLTVMDKIVGMDIKFLQQKCELHEMHTKKKI